MFLIVSVVVASVISVISVVVLILVVWMDPGKIKYVHKMNKIPRVRREIRAKRTP